MNTLFDGLAQGNRDLDIKPLEKTVPSASLKEVVADLSIKKETSSSLIINRVDDRVVQETKEFSNALDFEEWGGFSYFNGVIHGMVPTFFCFSFLRPVCSV